MALPEYRTAGSSALGYLYQCRIALLLGIRGIASAPDSSVSVERFDDVAFESHGEPLDLIQTKHHSTNTPSLSDKSTDLWRTLGNWCRTIDGSPSTCSLQSRYLITTSVAPDGSAASFLRDQGRDEDRADELLLAASSASTSQENAVDYDLYRSLSTSVRVALLRTVTVLDSYSDILDVREEIERELFLSVNRSFLVPLVDRLEGWWFDMLIKALSGTFEEPIPVIEIDQQIDHLRESFRRDSLPVDYGTKAPPPDVFAALDDRPFVTQLKLIEIGAQRIEYAIRDFYRASEQRSRWLREDLIVDGELDNYDRELVEAWEPRFAAMLEDSDAMQTVDGRVRLGRILFKWAEQDANFPFRGVYERFLTHGTFEILSNRHRLGWHPFYDES